MLQGPDEFRPRKGTNPQWNKTPSTKGPSLNKKVEVYPPISFPKGYRVPKNKLGNKIYIKINTDVSTDTRHESFIRTQM